MTEKPGPQFDVDAVGGMCEHPSPQAAQHDLEHRDHDQAEDQHIERAPAFVNEHLVDHDLGEQRRDQGKQLQEQRAHQGFAQQPTEAHDRRDEPGEVKGPGDTHAAFPRGHQDQLTRPSRVKYSALLNLRTIVCWILQQHAIGCRLGQDREGTVLQDRNCG